VCPFCDVFTIITSKEKQMAIAIYLLTVAYVGYVLYTVFSDPKKSL
jgi:hypothetical protein